jgi:hypothetical protein
MDLHLSSLYALTSVESPPAGGAELQQVVIATVAATLITAVLLYTGLGHRSGRVAFLQRIADAFERHFQVPGWLALPSTLATTSLIVALAGMYWDMSLHIDNGRDPGPLANPAHYLILGGLFGIFTAGFLAIVLSNGKPSAVSVRLGRDWWAPLGGILICACGAFSLIGFPLDDVWHRLFGQDVTLWGPTHLMLVGGAAMSLIGIAVLAVEGTRANAALETPRAETGHARLARTVAMTGGLLIGLSTFSAEFDFGVPQFRLVFQPMLIMLAAGIALVTARIYGGRGSALGAVAFFLLIRGGLTLLVGPVLGETTPHFPLYVVEALVVEAIAYVVSVERPLRFGLAAGLGIGTVGLAAEWAWSNVWMPIPWMTPLLPEGAVVGLLAAVCGAVLGAWIGVHLSIEPGIRRPALRGGAVLAALLVAGLVLYGLHSPVERGARAEVVLRDAGAGPGRQVDATIRLQPPDAAQDAQWLNVTAWQGGGELHVDPLDEIARGVYRTTEPLPVYGSWKALLRLHSGESLAALPIFMPRDPAIPVGEVPAPHRFERAFTAERAQLQRERKAGGPLLTAVAYSAVAAIALLILALLAWGLHRLAFGPTPHEPREAAVRAVGTGLPHGSRP